MFTKKTKLNTKIFTFITLASLLSTSLAETREWTSTKGTKIKAELVSQTETHVTLKKSNGKKLEVPIKSLTEADQQYIQSQKSPAEEDNAEQNNAKKSKGKKLLPTLKEGKGKGYFAYYEGNAYTATIEPNGSLVIRLTENGKTIDNWSLNIVPRTIHKPKGKQQRGLGVQKVIKHGDPVDSPEKIELTMLLKEDITAEVVYEFNAKGITTWMKTTEGKTTPSDVTHYLTHQFKSVKEVTTDIKDHKKMYLKGKDVKGKSIKYNYYELTRLGKNVSEFDVSMPAVSKVKISMEKSDDENVTLRTINYGDNALNLGYGVWFYKEKIGSSDQAKEKSTINFK